jgi:glycerophosphoryl diester phosphodiesterase
VFRHGKSFMIISRRGASPGWMWYDDIMGHGPGFAFLEHDGPIAFAHRGGIAADPATAENTMAVFQRALDMGFGYLETDVHTTSDGVLLVFHDAKLQRLTGTAGRLASEPYESLTRLRVANWHAIPRLEEVLAAFPDTRLNIDVKHARSPRSDWRPGRRGSDSTASWCAAQRVCRSRSGSAHCPWLTTC